MKKNLAILIFLYFFFSCTKEKDAAIVGTWKEIAVYRQDISGAFQWSYIPENLRFHYWLNFVSDGTWFATQEYGIGHGTYRYDYTSRQISYTSLPSGDLSSTPVSYLDKNYLVIDVLSNGVLVAKRKFERE